MPATARTTPTGLALLGAAVVAAGLTTYLARPARRFDAATRRRRALITYLLEHLSASEIALRMLRRLATSQRAAGDRAIYRRLAEELEGDRSVVRTLLGRLGSSGRSIKRVAGIASGTVVSAMVGGEPGELSLLRTLEALSVGAQGKRCMWRVLQNLRLPPSIAWDIDFVELEAKALRQWEAIEGRRCNFAPLTFSASDQRSFRYVSG